MPTGALHRPKGLAFGPLVATTYFIVSGGPYGLEDLVGEGYGTALLALAVTPWIWSLPTALMVGELASALPERGGYYAWVRRGLGPFWGFQEAWLSLVASVFDMAIYPTLFALYLGRFVPVVASGAGAIAAGVIVVTLGVAWNLRGARSVGARSTVLGALLLAPFAVLVALGIFRASAHPFAAPAAHRGGAALGGGIVIAMWNGMGWDNASTFADEILRPQRTLPLALIVTVGLVTTTYVAPVLAVAAAGLSPNGWTAGSWVEAARALGGDGLAAAVTVGGMLCGVGMFNALLLSYSRLPAVLAGDGYLPGWLAARGSTSDAPRAAIVASGVAYALCLGIGFRHLVALDVLLYGASLVLEFVTLVVLRVREPHLARPFKLPGGAGAMALLGALPGGLLLLAGWSCRDERVGPVPSLALGAALVAAGPVVYMLRRRDRDLDVRPRRQLVK